MREDHMEKPKKASDGDLIIPGAGPVLPNGARSDVFIAAPLAQVERQPQAGDQVRYLPSVRAPQGPAGNLHVEDSTRPMDAVIERVHGVRLVDLSVVDHKGDTHRVAFVPLVHYGDPDPDSPCGRCEWPGAIQQGFA